MTKKDDAFIAFENAMKNGATFVFIAERDGQVHVSGNCSKEWLAKILDVVRSGASSIADVPGPQVRVVEAN